ncbi:DUF1800 domain-containing protein [Flavobacterium galactosidilyticum]|uniref:DUF1800 domain-containing protein n=1 Tax=Flavobacterium galactosidilyticum TaxID=2893886 RepID=UPI001E564ABD|nr:DUF1800 domain-containing protein [Flavobacterium sp. F-340]UFH46424.1 DUF1800 domain-containing protein [Flavobacterium sp. F-340]
MDNNILWSLRLGFSSKEAQAISDLGLKKFLERSFESKPQTKNPDFLEDSPKTIEDFKQIRMQYKENNTEARKQLRITEAKVSQDMKAWWIDKMRTDEFPLREKMTCFWHNHFVATFQKVKVNYYIYQHHQIIEENAFGNFKELTKKILKSNAMVRYLDNTDNKRGKNNENLSRELLELFTLGIGNYTENDIKNGAKALAGLGIGQDGAQYRRALEDNDSKTYFGKTGNFKCDDLVDIIFEQKEIPYLLTRKILGWFIYDTPKDELVRYYGDYFREMNFEIKPLLTKIFKEEYSKNNAGSKIKNPLEYILQLMSELHIDNSNSKAVAFFIKEQGMDLFNQPNVKGWVGGNSWLTSQVYLQRNNMADLLCSGRGLNRKNLKPNEEMTGKSFNKKGATIDWDNNGNNKKIIAELKDRLLCEADAVSQKDFETIIKYDFNPKAENANQVVLRLFNAMVKMPEYQLI